MLDWTNCKKGALNDTKGDLIFWPPEDKSEVILTSELELKRFCQEEEVVGRYILPIYMTFAEGLLFCKQELYIRPKTHIKIPLC